MSENEHIFDPHSKLLVEHCTDMEGLSPITSCIVFGILDSNTCHNKLFSSLSFIFKTFRE